MATMKIGNTEFELVATVSESCGYEWHEGALLRHEDGRLFFVSGAGCSCNWLGDYETEDDLVPVASYAAAVEEAKKEFSDSDVFDFAQQLFG